MQGTNIKPFMQSKTAWKVISTPDTPAVAAGGQRRGRDMNKRMALPEPLPPSPFSMKTSGYFVTHSFKIEISWMYLFQPALTSSHEVTTFASWGLSS